MSDHQPDHGASSDDTHRWFEPAQQHALHTAVGILRTWAEAEDDVVLRETLDAQDPDTALVGLATAARILAVELGLHRRRSELAVLAELGTLGVASGPEARLDDRVAPLTTARRTR